MKWVAILLIVGLSGCTTHSGPEGAIESFLGGYYDGEADVVIASLSSYQYNFNSCEDDDTDWSEVKEDIEAEIGEISQFLQMTYERSEFVNLDELEMFPAAEDPIYNQCENFVFKPSDLSGKLTMEIDRIEGVESYTADIFVRYEASRWVILHFS